MTRVAVVDLGSNSTRLLVADVEDDVVHEIERRVTITKLGERVDGDRQLLPRRGRSRPCLPREPTASSSTTTSPSGPSRTRRAPSATPATGPSSWTASSGASTSRRACSQARRRLCSRSAASRPGRPLLEPTVIVDLGGGSTEIVIGDASGLTFHASLDIGCVRLAERFARADALEACDAEALVLHVRRLLMEQIPLDSPPAHGIGAAGTVTTLGTLHLGLDEEDPEVLHGHRLPAAWIGAEAGRLAATPVAELRRRAGIEPERAAVIGAGALAIAEIVAFFELDGARDLGDGHPARRGPRDGRRSHSLTRSSAALTADNER